MICSLLPRQQLTQRVSKTSSDPAVRRAATAVPGCSENWYTVGRRMAGMSHGYDSYVPKYIVVQAYTGFGLQSYVFCFL